MGTCGLVAMTSAPHAEGRQFDPGQVYFLVLLVNYNAHLPTTTKNSSGRVMHPALLRLLLWVSAPCPPSFLAMGVWFGVSAQKCGVLLFCSHNFKSWMPSSGYIAQWLERLTADQQVPGSNPGVPSWPLCSSGSRSFMPMYSTCSCASTTSLPPPAFEGHKPASLLRVME